MSVFSAIKRALVGKPIHSKHAHHERLPKIFALPVFASDALSSVAYATEQIMLVLVGVGTMAFSHTMPISIAIAVLLVIVSASYFQTILSYPQGGGSYRVATDNLGSVAGRVAGASLLIDYVLTVAVSVSAGVAAIISMAPATHDYMIPMGVFFVALVGLLNLRGAKESGAVFAVPTYSFVFLIFLLLAFAIFKIMGGQSAAITREHVQGAESLSLFLILRAFAAGCTALTGVEAIADGVQAFRPPEAKNASQTLVAMAVLLLTMFLGLSFISNYFPVTPMHEADPQYMTIIAQIANSVFPKPLFFALQIATAAILVLAANTAFADFPRLSSFIARDGFLPRQLGSVGDRLVFQNGILLLSGLAILLIIVFHGQTALLIPLYAVGVFTSFTLSQAGMVVRLRRTQQALWKQAVSTIGCIVTFVVTLIILGTKFREGAYLILVAETVLLFTFSKIKQHYNYLANELTIQPQDELLPVGSTVLLLVPRLHRGILQAIAYAKSMARDVRALHVTLDPKSLEQVKKDWARFGADIPLVILESPYRSLNEPIIEYIEETLSEDPTCMITVIVPQAVPKRWYHGILHNNAAVALKLALASKKNVVITNVRYFLK